MYAKNRHDIAGQLMEIDWHVCLGDSSVQQLQKLQLFMSETGQAPWSFPDRIIFASMFNNTNWEIRRCKPHVLVKWLLTQQYSDLGIGVSVIQDRKRHGHRMKIDRLTNLLTMSGTNSLAGRQVNFISSKHPEFECSNILPRGALMKRMQ